MRMEYRVVWREGASPLATGKLELLADRLRLAGGERSCEIPYDRVLAMRIGQAQAERIRGRKPIVIERLEGAPVTIAPLGHASLVGEIAERLVAAQLEDASFLATPGPGDSEGGDIY